MNIVTSYKKSEFNSGQNLYTHVIYDNHSTYIDTDPRYNDYRLLRARNKIKQGELILIELVFAGKDDICIGLIRDNEYIFNELCPRKNKWNEFADRNNDSIHKLQLNHFGKDEELLIFGVTVSKLNHSCKPNCAIFICAIAEQQTIEFYYVAVCALKKIKPGEEITIAYDLDKGHIDTDDFKCNCARSLNKRTKIWNKINRRTERWQTERYNEFRAYSTEFESTSYARNIFAHQYACTRGLILNTNIIFRWSRFKRYMDRFYNDQDMTEKEKVEKYMLDVYSMFNEI